MASSSGMSSTVATTHCRGSRAVDSRSGWRFWVVAGVWGAIVAGVVFGFQTLGLMLGTGIGYAWGTPAPPDHWVGVWWRFIAIVMGLGIAAFAAISLQRWVALVLAVLIAGAAGFFAIAVFPSVRSVVAPVSVEHVDRGPLPCQCYSGNGCDCPGG